MVVRFAMKVFSDFFFALGVIKCPRHMNNRDYSVCVHLFLSYHLFNMNTIGPVFSSTQVGFHERSRLLDKKVSQ